jgi:hypothetical protein
VGHILLDEKDDTLIIVLLLNISLLTLHIF